MGEFWVFTYHDFSRLFQKIREIIGEVGRDRNKQQKSHVSELCQLLK